MYRTSHPEPIAELRAGELVGEIGFFANIPRTANVIAIRDTSVLVLTRAAYTTLARETPEIVEALLAALARRFATETARLLPLRASPKARTVALIPGGREPVPAALSTGCAKALPLRVPRSSTSRGSRRCFPAARWTHPKSPTGSTGSSTTRRW
ncbi:cyclic nucleotide-binding domain-containing protein [Bradyrhizobium elkanii]|nr:cyclic nucleotide-binding domain-containing protein [Bradyrhizobium elkanii]